MASFGRKLVRKKYIDLNDITSTKLARCLTTFDLTALGNVIIIFSENILFCIFLCTNIC